MLLNLIMIFGPSLAYVPQYRAIQALPTTTVSTFSTYTCLVLLVSNLLRIVFWIGKRFDSVYLWQSIFQVLAQLWMLELCVSRRDSLPHASATQRIRKAASVFWKPKLFWRWQYFEPYMMWLVSFHVMVLLIFYASGANPVFVEVIGFVALTSESMLGCPQVLANHQGQSSAGLGNTLLITWIAGDAFKTWFFLSSSAPLQFVVCGIVQLTVDAVLVFQKLTLPEK